MRSHPGRICPLICGARQELKGGRCVRKTCARGETLNHRGKCVAVKKKEERNKKAKTKREREKQQRTRQKKSRRKQASTGGNCRMETRLECAVRVCPPEGRGCAKLRTGICRSAKRRRICR